MRRSSARFAPGPSALVRWVPWVPAHERPPTPADAQWTVKSLTESKAPGRPPTPRSPPSPSPSESPASAPASTRAPATGSTRAACGDAPGNRPRARSSEAFEGPEANAGPARRAASRPRSHHCVSASPATAPRRDSHPRIPHGVRGIGGRKEKGGEASTHDTRRPPRGSTALCRLLAAVRPYSAGCTISANADRARFRRDFTVPRLQCVISAISS